MYVYNVYFKTLFIFMKVRVLITWLKVEFRRVVLGDTDDTSIYRDTKISRYWYRVFLHTFWYRYFISILHVAKPFNTLFS